MAKAKKSGKSKLSAKRARISEQNRAIGLLVVSAAVAILLGLLYFGGATLVRYKAAAERAEVEPVRELIISAVDSTRVPASVDAQTGDIYFPQANLYIPAPDTPTSLFYLADESVGDENAIRVTSKFALESAKARLYSAETKKELWRAVPSVQACARGVLITGGTVDTEDNDLALVDTRELEDGRQISVYREANCKHLDDVVDLVLNVRSY